MTKQIGPMTKVSIAILAGSEPGIFSFTKESVAFDFIYGIGVGGLTPFELAFENKGKDDIIRLQIGAKSINEFFGPFLPHIRNAVGLLLIPDTVWFQMEIIGVATAENREIVKAMANSLGKGCGGHSDSEDSCGCGCG